MEYENENVSNPQVPLPVKLPNADVYTWMTPVVLIMAMPLELNTLLFLTEIVNRGSCELGRNLVGSAAIEMKAPVVAVLVMPATTTFTMRPILVQYTVVFVEGIGPVHADVWLFSS
jgi:hypothetical protein